MHGQRSSGEASKLPHLFSGHLDRLFVGRDLRLLWAGVPQGASNPPTERTKQPSSITSSQLLPQIPMSPYHATPSRNAGISPAHNPIARC